MDTEKILAAINSIRSDMAADKKEFLEKLDEVAKIKVLVDNLQSKVNTLESESARLKPEVSATRLMCNLNEQHAKSSNLLLFGVPGKVDEPRNETEAMTRKLLAVTEVKQTLVCAQRLNRKNVMSPILVTFECKPHAQDAFHLVRKMPNLNAGVLELDENSRIDVRFHLSKHLTHLLKSASLLKREISWSMCRPHSDTQTVELKKDGSSEAHVFSNIEELIAFKDQMIEKKILSPASPAANIGRPQRVNRKRAESKATAEANAASHASKKKNQNK